MTGNMSWKYFFSTNSGHRLNWLHNLWRTNLLKIWIGNLYFGSLTVKPLTSVVCRRRFGYFSDQTNHDYGPWRRSKNRSSLNLNWRVLLLHQGTFRTSAASNFMNEDVCSHQGMWWETFLFLEPCVCHFNYPNDALTSRTPQEAARATLYRVFRESSSSNVEILMQASSWK